MAEQMDDDDDAMTIAQSSYFRGKATQVEREASSSFAEIKGYIQQGQWLEVLPILLTIGGLFGILLFGSLAALVAIENKLLGLVIVIVAVYAILRMLLAFRRA
jgi:hypothetical protein